MADEIYARTATRGLGGVRQRPAEQLPPLVPDGWVDFDDEVTTYPAAG
ncbi:hypothetical protein [Amycolatopsis taiwanensis]|nr:hypothetical protein [Amycolatopsis taiwanensis]